jgi:CheY-like chemotaxis protein
MPTALIVEDSPDARYLLRAILQGSGYRVLEAADGAQALEIARGETPDVVISDVAMPAMDGFELCRAWMQDPALRQVPFVFYSATYLEPDHERLALDLGARRYLVKPQEPEIFLRQLAMVLVEHREGALGTSGAPSMSDQEFRERHQYLRFRKKSLMPSGTFSMPALAAKEPRARALVVDDNPAGRRLLRALLEGSGYQVVEAADGMEALKAARHKPPDVVISDVLMPNLDGFSLCWHWMGDPRLRDVPFVFYSAAFAEAEHERFAADLGAACFIPKPTEPEPFFEQLHRVLERYRSGALGAGDREQMPESEFRRRLARALGGGD